MCARVCVSIRMCGEHSRTICSQSLLTGLFQTGQCSGEWAKKFFFFNLHVVRFHVLCLNISSTINHRVHTYTYFLIPSCKTKLLQHSNGFHLFSCVCKYIKKISFFNVENEKIETIYWANNSYRWKKKTTANTLKLPTNN